MKRWKHFFTTSARRYRSVTSLQSSTVHNTRGLHSKNNQILNVQKMKDGRKKMCPKWKKWHFDTCDVTGVDTDVPFLCIWHINRRVLLYSTINIKLCNYVYAMRREKMSKNLKKCDELSTTSGSGVIVLTRTHTYIHTYRHTDTKFFMALSCSGTSKTSRKVIKSEGVFFLQSWNYEKKNQNSVFQQKDETQLNLEFRLTK
jgi:hypothetical protein